MFFCGTKLNGLDGHDVDGFIGQTKKNHIYTKQTSLVTGDELQGQNRYSRRIVLLRGHLASPPGVIYISLYNNCRPQTIQVAVLKTISARVWTRACINLITTTVITVTV